MAPISAKLLEEVRQTPGATDVDTSEEQARPEVRVNVNRRAAGDLGLDLGTVASTVRGLVAGEVVSQFEDHSHLVHQFPLEGCKAPIPSNHRSHPLYCWMACEFLSSR